jgi:hypothetical protein
MPKNPRGKSLDSTRLPHADTSFLSLVDANNSSEVKENLKADIRKHPNFNNEVEKLNEEAKVTLRVK